MKVHTKKHETIEDIEDALPEWGEKIRRQIKEDTDLQLEQFTTIWNKNRVTEKGKIYLIQRGRFQ